jgi:hypothetical protein
VLIRSREVEIIGRPVHLSSGYVSGSYSELKHASCTCSKTSFSFVSVRSSSSDGFVGMLGVDPNCE